ncbi:N-(5-phosphoribosyl)anthranilate isomerase [Rhodopirellula maiorica SM1]|uniref:N-(5'-phosphoribosyl)anthranilate isomerase n=1 Tax=Rhodopirellula maiorica SM1 TaxID=1265738 RepID=M5RV31_9BACT|nr:phosphoribosylanthranilate isomerase [Rhodopirellula maiorica]EMI23061.1 N-(5-phosphoribosyl)anthranilate isomerase [Rhodopirellula maiorica SM1]
MFHIKICGVLLKTDIDAVHQAGGDAVGLNFYPPSVRYLDPQAAGTRVLSAYAADCGLYRVGVFVNEPADSIREVIAEVGLDAIQLHGDELVSDVPVWTKLGLPLMRAVKIPGDKLSETEIEDRVRPWIDAGCHVLLDADAGSAHGGIGRSLDWDSLRDWSARFAAVRWTLAGGLRPENVAEAIRVSGARSVDVASGVESPRGQKSAALIAAFCKQAKNAFG